MTKPKPTYQHKDSGSTGDCGIQGGFAPGNTGGRPPGVPNKLTSVLRQAIVLAAQTSKHADGSLESYCRFLANEHPVAFARHLLSRLLPHRFNIDVAADVRLETPAEIREQLAAKGIPIDRLATLFEMPKVPKPRPLEPPAEPDEDRLRREPEPDRVNESTSNGLDRRHEPSRRRYGAGEPVKDVRDHEAAVWSPSLGGWHGLPPGRQMDLPIDNHGDPDADRDPEAA
jgi:hypothetical protein